VIVAAAGIDTWSPAWYVDEGSAAARAMRELASVPSKMGLRLLPEQVDGHRVGWYERSHMVVAEGHPGGDRLGSPDELPAALGRLEAAIGDYGIRLPSFEERARWRDVDGANFHGEVIARRGFAGIRRLDATADLSFDTRAEGQAVLDGVAAVARMRQKAEVWYERGAVQTVYFLGHAGKRKLGRWYDKGAESGLAPRGRLIRPEDQRRYVSGTRRDVYELTTDYVRQKFQQRFVPLWRASKGVVVASSDGLTDRVVELLQAGELTVAEAERLAGYLALRSRMRGGDFAPTSEEIEAVHEAFHDDLRHEELPRRSLSRTTQWRRERALLDHGLVPADEAGTETTVDLHAILEAVLDSDAWDRRG